MSPERDAANIDIAALLAEKEDKVRAYIRQKDTLADSLQNQLSALQQDFLYNLELARDYKRQLETGDLERESLQAALVDRDDRINKLGQLVQEKTGSNPCSFDNFKVRFVICML
jgi:hypothetical protein